MCRSAPCVARGAAGAAPLCPHYASANVEDRAVPDNSWRRRLDVVIRLEALRRRDTLEDSGRRARSVAAHGQDTGAPVRERDLEHSDAVRRRALVDVVDDVWWQGLGPCVLPTDERRDLVGAASAARGRPGAASVHRSRPAAACGRDEVAGPREGDRVAVGRGGGRGTSWDDGRRYPSAADDVPANVLRASTRCG